MKNIVAGLMLLSCVSMTSAIAEDMAKDGMKKDEHMSESMTKTDTMKHGKHMKKETMSKTDTMKKDGGMMKETKMKTETK